MPLEGPDLQDYKRTRYLVNRSQTAETPYLGNGTTFPPIAGVPIGALYNRTDLGRIFESNGTNWLSVDRIPVTFTFKPSLSSSVLSAADSGSFQVSRASTPTNSDLYLECFTMNTYPQGTLNPASYWTWTLFKQDSTITNTAIATQSYNLRTTGQFYLDNTTTFTGGAIHTLTQAYTYFVSFTVTGTPGTLTIYAPTLTFRAVAY